MLIGRIGGENAPASFGEASGDRSPDRARCASDERRPAVESRSQKARAIFGPAAHCEVP